ncbi:dolichyl-diphosphooligosaccharide--protein glycosyltransferase subunit 2-like isoform X1 [Penaeus japonicus]|uniref:dolichyl-diphosphooligosaccharide--protein glycosyltransferase subunit 2-like isoform X1 n=1 Tax=Penaeus japonicus TaxID=27405 RepID=UPI001C717615|nr:dolichyl-diphosphooligosaccharide--protein glycosyltransferase subunit 2-like isoform X1 [Penaeus japonicus]
MGSHQRITDPRNYRALVILALLGVSSALSPSTYLTPADKERLKLVLDPAWSLSDLAQVLYASAGYKHLGQPIPNEQGVCNFVKSSASDGATVETLFLASSAGKALGCPVAATAASKQAVSEAIREGASPQELFHAVTAATNLGVEVDVAKVLRATQMALKKDDSVLSLGYAFHVGSQLRGEVGSIFERIEDAIVQADEVDGRMLQFEGGLSITALVLSGAYKLAENSNKAPPIKPDQAVKFANYLMSRKSVQVPKGVYYLLEAVSMFTSNRFHIPVAITLASNVAVSADAPRVQVRVTDLKGSSLGSLRVVADSATRDSDEVVIVSKEELSPLAGQDGVYEFDVMSRQPERGFYRLVVSTVTSDSRLVGHMAAQLTFKVLTAIDIQGVEVGTADSDRSTAPSLQKLTYPKSLPTELMADQHQRVLLRFIVRDLASGRSTEVHQAFVKITHIESKREIIFVAETDSNDVYKFDMDVSNNVKEFGGVSGSYSMELIIGDASISNPTLWHIGDVALSFPEGSVSTSSQDYTYKARPEIQHEFRKPDPRPSTLVSLTFTILCLVPLLLLLAMWAKLGVNLSNFPVSLSAFVFHIGLAAILGLFCLFWLQLDMFTTLRYLFMVGVVTFFSGNSMLSNIAANRKEQEVKMVYGPYYNKSYRFSQNQQN